MALVEDITKRRGGRDARRTLRSTAIPMAKAAVKPGMEGGQYRPLKDADMKRMKKLYEKVMNDTISKAESVELDGLMEACAAMDVLRARVLLGHEPLKARTATRA